MNTTRCTCGEVIKKLDEHEDPTLWFHVSWTATCWKPKPAEGDALAYIGQRLSAAASELSELREQSDSVLARMEALDRMALSPATVRHGTLIDVWDRMLADGNIAGAQLVKQMIDESKGGS